LAISRLEELQWICQKLLDNADLNVSFDEQTSEIILCFIVAVSYEQIVFRCGRFHSFKLVKNPDEGECFFVGETSVSIFTKPEEIKQGMESEGWSWGKNKFPSQLYLIEVKGGVEVRLLCENFTWSLSQSEGHTSESNRT